MPKSPNKIVAIIGLGKIGLPLAAQILSKGFEVIGCDKDPKVLEKIESGVEKFEFEPGLYERIQSNKANLQLTTSPQVAAQKAQTVIIVVPLVVDDRNVPDFTNLQDASKQVAHGLTPGSLVIYETTLPIGATKNFLTPLLESESGLVEGRDFFTAFAPERVSSGTVFADLQKYPKIVGACSYRGAIRVEEFYDQILDFEERSDLKRQNGVWLVEDSTAAEFVKLAETTFRDVNIALANTFSMHAATMGLDFSEIREAANSQPFSMIHEPGISVGGHCIPVYPHLYLQSDPKAQLVTKARELNLSMPDYAVERLKTLVGDLHGRKVSILGLAYRPGIKEHAFSGTIRLKKLLNSLGALVSIVDPLYTSDELSLLGFSAEFVDKEAQALIIHTNHLQFANLSPNAYPNCKIAIEGRKPILSEEFRNQIRTTSLFGP